MTAVAEGASLFAESIDWSSQNRTRKNTRGQISSGGGLALSFNYIARTPDVKAKVAVQLEGQAAAGSEFQIDSVDTGWTSGRLPLKHGATIDVTLTKAGDNTFKVFVFDAVGGPIALEQDKIVITRTAASVDAIPASHSVGVEVLEKLGGRPVLDYLVHSGDSLPKKGKKVYKAAESLKAGASGSLNLKLWEGEIDDPVTDNRPIGFLKISGSDFVDGVIHSGADLECEYEILDSGTINIVVSVPCIGGTFHSGKNFYSRQEGQLDFTAAAVVVVEEGERTLNRIDEINEVVDNPKLDQARRKLESAVSLDPGEAETEKSQEAMDRVFEARKLLAQVRKEHLKDIRQIDLDGVVSFFDKHIRQHARPSEASAFDNLTKTAQRSIDGNNTNFEQHLDELRGKNFEILWRQDWFVVERFKWIVRSPHRFTDKHRYEELTQIGTKHMRSDDIVNLRAVVAQLSMIQIGRGPDDEMLDVANIIRG
jgi:molecular chaperone DnaK